MRVLFRPKPMNWNGSNEIYLGLYDAGYTKVRNQANGACLEVRDMKEAEEIRKIVSGFYKGDFGIYKEE